MKSGIMFIAGTEVDGDLFFSAHQMNGIFKQDGKTKKIKYLGSVKEETENGRLHNIAIHHADRIYFIPSIGDYIAKWDLTTSKIETIAIPSSNHACETVKFSDAILIGKQLWLTPMGYDAILMMDLDTEKIERYADWPDGVEWKDPMAIQFRSGLYIPDMLCLCPRDSKVFVTFDLKSKKMKAWDWEYSPNAFCGMVYDNDNIWLVPRLEYPYIVKYNIKEESKTLIPTGEIFEEGIMSAYSSAVIVDDWIVCTPYESRNWRLINKKTDEVMYEQFVDSRIEDKEEYPYYQHVTKLKNGVKVSGSKRTGAHFISATPFRICEEEYEIEDIEFLIYSPRKRKNLLRKQDWIEKNNLIGKEIYNELIEMD